jgi:hypothetical protein
LLLHHLEPSFRVSPSNSHELSLVTLLNTSLLNLRHSTPYSLFFYPVSTTNQVILRWNIQRGVSIIPKSIQLPRIAENFDILEGFALSDEDMAVVSALGVKNVRYNDPGVFCKGMGGTASEAIPIYA